MSAHKHSWEDDHFCYVCGNLNGNGLRLEFTVSKTEITTEFVPVKSQQGYKDILHGGFLAMLMDEVMALLPIRLYGDMVVTAEINTRLLKPVPVGQKLRIRGFFEGDPKKGRRMYEMGAECLLPDGTVAARASGKVVRVS